MGIYCLLDFGQKIHWMAPAEGILFLSNLVFVEWSIKLLAAVKLLPSISTKKKKNGILEHLFYNILYKAEFCLAHLKCFCGLYKPCSYHCFILWDWIIVLHNARCNPQSLILKFLSCIPVAVYPSQEKKMLDVLIVRQEVTKSSMFVFCVLVYFKY